MNMRTWNDYKEHVAAVDPDIAKDIREAEAMRGNRDILVIRYRPNQEDWSFKTGFHGIYTEFWEDEGNWRNVAFAKYYEIAGIRIELK